MKRLISTFSILMAAIGSTFAQAPVKDVMGNLTGTVNWSNDTIYMLKGKVYVKSGATLNIAPGTVIKGDLATAGSTLIVTRGAKIYAIGTPTQPIVFTSSATPGNKSMGDWGGIVIAGNARVNVPGGEGTFEGGNLSNPDGTVSDGKYGGLNDLDNSGELKYVRIEYAGFAFAPNNELNSLTLGGVGSGTKISHVQCSYGLDDAFEWFGGTVDADHLIAFRGNDDDFDTDFGFSGRVQFGVCLRDTAVADAVSGAMAFESDNDGGGSTNTPKTKPIFSNMTLIGPRFTPTTTYDPNFRRGAHIRRHSEMSLFNSIVMGWPTGIKIDGDSCQANANNSLLKIKNTVISGSTLDLDSAATTTSWGITPWYYTSGWDNVSYTANTDVMLTSPFNYTNPDFRPAAGSPMLSGASFTDAFLTSGFTSVAYRGAFGGTDWTASWTNFNPDTASYNYGYIAVGVNNPQIEKMNVTIYPNPSNSEARISFNLKNAESITLDVMDLNGKVLFTQNQNCTKGFNAIQFSTANLPNGFYMIKLKGANQMATEKFSVLK
jgi:hypothetical protein